MEDKQFLVWMKGFGMKISHKVDIGFLKGHYDFTQKMIVKIVKGEGSIYS